MCYCSCFGNNLLIRIFIGLLLPRAVSHWTGLNLIFWKSKSGSMEQQKYFRSEDGSYVVERINVREDGTCFVHALWAVGIPLTKGKENLDGAEARRRVFLDEVYGQEGVGDHPKCREEGEFLGSLELARLKDGQLYLTFDGSVARSNKYPNSYPALAINPNRIHCSEGKEFGLPCLVGEHLRKERKVVEEQQAQLLSVASISSRTRRRTGGRGEKKGEEANVDPAAPQPAAAWAPVCLDKKYPTFFLIHYAQGIEGGRSQHWEGARLWRREVGQGGVRKPFEKSHIKRYFESATRKVEEVKEMTPLEFKELIEKWPLVLPKPIKGQKRALPSVDGGEISD
jgi:hypothetical protein